MPNKDLISEPDMKPNIDLFYKSKYPIKVSTLKFHLNLDWCYSFLEYWKDILFKISNEATN